MTADSVEVTVTEEDTSKDITVTLGRIDSATEEGSELLIPVLLSSPLEEGRCSR